MHASAYAPSSHLVFHSLWQVGMSLGTVMTDSLCLPKVRLEKPALAALLWNKKEKQEKKTDCTCPILWAPQIILHETANQLSSWFEDPIRWSSSDPPALLQIYLYAFHESSVRAIYLSRLTRAVGMRDGLTFGSHPATFVINLWQGEVMWPGHWVLKIFDNIWKTLTMKLWAKVRNMALFWGKMFGLFFASSLPSASNHVKNIESQHVKNLAPSG